MSDITMIALSKLVPGRADVRKTKPAISIDELAASISSHGLLQNLVDSHFAHIRKDAIVEALVEISPHLDRAALGKAPKKEVLARAKKAFKKVNWLPPVLRTGARPETPAIAAE